MLEQLQQHAQRSRNQVAETLQDAQPDYLISNYQQSALDTLAEVSRHHLDFSAHFGNVAISQDEYVHDHSSSNTFIEQALVARLQGYTSTEEVTNATELQMPDLADVSNVEISGLVETASAAHQQMESVQPAVVLDDEALPGLADQVEAEVEVGMQAVGPVQNTVIGPKWPGKGTTYRPDTSLDEPVYKKVRGNFDQSRRQEVAKIRKSGACIRCRMLKKSCSGETPCTTCKNIESARIWKGQCLRTRVADAFTLWSNGLYTKQAMTATEPASGVQLDLELPTVMTMRFVTTSDVCVKFMATTRTPAIDSQNGDPDVRLVSNDENLLGAIGEYVTATADHIIAQEQFQFVQATVQRAQMLARVEDTEHASKVAGVRDQQSTRSRYGLQQRLLKNVLDLWLSTALLTMQSRYPLQIQYRTDAQVASQAELTTWACGSVEGGWHAVSTTSAQYAALQAQAMALLETRCNTLSKIVMNELEHRLLQRQQASRFATLISAVLLLNCVERLTGIYRKLDSCNGPAARQTSQGLDSTTMQQGRTAGQHDRDDSTPALWEQGPRFAELLIMLLRLRGLPPKTYHTIDGMLAVTQDYLSPVQVLNKALKAHVHEHAKIAGAWLDPLRLNVAEMIACRDGSLPTAEDEVELWDMRFIARVLVPEDGD